jgi:hypothetical protein
LALEAAITNKNKNQCIKILQEIPPEQAPLIIETLLKSYSDIKHLTDPGYEFLIDVIHRVYPKIESYINLDSILTLEGVKTMVTYFKEREEKAGRSLLETTVCPNIRNFKDEMKAKALSLEEGKIHSFIVIHQPTLASSNQTPHYSIAFLAKSKEGKIRMFIFDSLGIKVESKKIKHERYTGDMRVATQHILPQSDVYAFSWPRQMDETNCPIFCFRDLIQASRHRDVFDFIIQHAQVYGDHPDLDKQEDVEENEGKYYLIDILPAYMVKTMQNRKRIEQYLEAINARGQEEGKDDILSLTNKKQQKENLESNFERHCIEEGSNQSIKMFFRKSERIIIGKVIKMLQ